MRLQQTKCCLGVDAVSFHENAFGLFDDRAATERTLQVLELREAPERDVEGALEFRGFLSVEDDIGEDTAPGRLMDVARVFRIDERDDRARGLMHDPSDLLERVLAIKAQSNERDLLSRLLALSYLVS